MAPGPSLLPVRPGRAGPSALPRAVPSVVVLPQSPLRGTTKNLVDTSPHAPVPSTSRLSPALQSPPRSDFDASRLEWADLLDADPGDDLLNEQSGSWLLDQSAFTIAAKTPAKTKTARKRSPTPLNELYRLDELTDEDPAAGPVAAVHVLADASPRTVRTPSGDAQALAASSVPAMPPPLSLPSQPLPTVAEEASSSLASAEALEAARPVLGEVSDGERPSSPPGAQLKSATPALEAKETKADRAPRRHRPSLAPLSTGNTETVETFLPRSRSRSTSPAMVPVIAPIREQLARASPGETATTPAPNNGQSAQEAETAEAAVPASGPFVDDQLALSTVPAATVESDSGDVGPVARAKVVRAPPVALPTVAPVMRRVPRASLAVTSRAKATGPTRPAHLLPPDHPAHPRPSLITPSLSSSLPSAAPISALSNSTVKPKPTAKAKGVPEADEEARRRVREAKETREKSAKERRDKAERHAAALREERRREKVAAEAAAAPAPITAASVGPAESTRPIKEHQAPTERGKGEGLRPAGSLGEQAPSDSLGAISSKKPLDANVAGDSTAGADVPTVPIAATAPSRTSASTAPPAPTAPTVPTAPTEPIALGHRDLPLVVVESVDDSQHQSMAGNAFDANMTLPDMGAPLDFGSASMKQAQPALGSPSFSAATSTPARLLKRKAESGGAPRQGEVGETAGVSAPPKRARRPSIAAAQVKSRSAPSKDASALDTQQTVVERPISKSNVPSTAASVMAQRAAPKRRASRLPVDTDCAERVDVSQHLRDQSAASQPGRARVVRVTLQVPAAPQGQPAPLPTLLADPDEAARLSAEAKKRRRASRITSPSANPAVSKPASSPEPAPAPIANVHPHHLLKHSRSVPVVSAPAPVNVELPPRPPVMPALVIGGITLPASFTFAEPEEVDEAERAKRLQEKERREQLAEAVLAEKKRVRESTSAWAVRPDEATKRRRIVEPSSQHGSEVGDAHTAPAAAAAAGSAKSAIVRTRDIFRTSEQICPSPATTPIEASTSSSAEVSFTTAPAEPVALTKEALERNSRKAGPRPDLQRRVSRFLEEISEAEEPLEDVLLPDGQEASDGLAASTNKSGTGVGAAAPGEITGLAVKPVFAGRAQSPAAGRPVNATIAAVVNAVEAASNKEVASAKPMRNAPIVEKRALPEKPVATTSTVLRPATKRPAEVVKTISDPQATKKARRDEPALAAASAARVRPTGQENGVTRHRPQGPVAAEIEKQLQARLAWSERQKKREEEAKAFRQRQRDEEANRERVKLAQLRSSLQQARRPVPPPKPAARLVSRT